MKNNLSIIKIIKSKIIRTDFVLKFILCLLLEISILRPDIEMVNYECMSVGGEKGNLLMYLLAVFTDYSTAYYYVLIAFSILVSDIVYEQYLTKNIYILYGSRKKVYYGMLKLTAAFSLLFITVYLVLAIVTGIMGGLDISFEYADKTIDLLADEQQFYLIRASMIYLPKSVLNYNGLFVLGLVVFKYYVGLILLSMTGLVFSIKKDSVQYGALTILLILLFNIAVLEYNGPWTFYRIGIQVDLTGIFSYITFQRFFIYDFAGIRDDVIYLFGNTMLTGVIWFIVLSFIINHLIKNKDI